MLVDKSQFFPDNMTCKTECNLSTGPTSELESFITFSTIYHMIIEYTEHSKNREISGVICFIK